MWLTAAFATWDRGECQVAYLLAMEKQSRRRDEDGKQQPRKWQMAGMGLMVHD
jgi:hypothetical protein